MRLISVLVFGLLACAAFAANAQEEEAAPPVAIGDCTPPEAPTVPDGNVAPASELKAASTAVKAYMAAGGDYTDCLDDHEESLGDEISEEQESALITAHNAMVDAMTATAAEFNEALTTYREKKKQEKEAAASSD